LEQRPGIAPTKHEENEMSKFTQSLIGLLGWIMIGVVIGIVVGLVASHMIKPVHQFEYESTRVLKTSTTPQPKQLKTINIMTAHSRDSTSSLMAVWN